MPSMAEADTPKYSTAHQCCGAMFMKGINVSAVTIATRMPRLIAPAMKPMDNSSADRGGIRKSTELPCTLDTRIEEPELAKALFNRPIRIRPGARNSMKGTPATSPRRLPIATAKTVMYSSVVATGAATVCMPTFRKRRTSFLYRVHRPKPLIRPNFLGPFTGVKAALLISNYP